MGAATVVSLAEELTISAAAQQHARLLQAVQEADEGALALDLGQVEACDSAGVQLLLATRASALARGMQVHITAASTPVRQALATFGLAGAWLEDGSAS